jgi:hypothetical protein
MKEALFTLNRDAYLARTTLGELLTPGGKHFCFTLEDTVRGYGIKVKKETAIPSTGDGEDYYMTVRNSPKYGEVVVIYTREKEGIYYLENGGVSFQMILAHGGNDHGDTEGCILVNKNRLIKEGSAWGTMKKAILQKVKELEADGFTVRLRINNLSQRN